MRVAGYVRESADADRFRTAFAQNEDLRRYCSERALLMVAVCQDLRQSGHATGRDGYLSLLGVIAAGAVDAVVVAGLDTISDEAAAQELALWDLRRRGVQVLSTRPEDGSVLGGGGLDVRRDAMREVLEQLTEPSVPMAAPPSDAAIAPDGDVLVQIIAADDAERRAAS
ncbi:MAG: recombinase family protein [Acidimicrobiia bacterium]